MLIVNNKIGSIKCLKIKFIKRQVKTGFIQYYGIVAFKGVLVRKKFLSCFKCSYYILVGEGKNRINLVKRLIVLFFIILNELLVVLGSKNVFVLVQS